MNAVRTSGIGIHARMSYYHRKLPHRRVISSITSCFVSAPPLDPALAETVWCNRNAGRRDW